MTSEHAFFIQVLSDHLAERKTILYDILNWAEIMKISQSHQVDGIVFYQCKDIIPQGIRSSFEQAYGTTLYYHVNRKLAMDEITTALEDAKLPFFTVKGFTVAQYYPLPALRTMGDCDIIVHHADMQAAIAILKEMGFQGSKLTIVQEWGCDRNGLHFELHDSLVQNGEFTTWSQVKFFNEFDPYISNEGLDWSFHFLFLLMHLRKHLLYCGAGFRQFMDLAVVIRNGPDLNWDWIQERLHELHLYQFACICCAMLENWFDISAPLDYKPLDPKLQENLTEMILRGGVFGFSDENNLLNYSKTALAKTRGPRLVKSFLRLFHSAFPRYKMMQGYPGCTYLSGRPYLLPAAWLHRFFILLCRKDKSSTFHTVRSSFAQSAEISAREELLKEIGL